MPTNKVAVSSYKRTRTPRVKWGQHREEIFLLRELPIVVSQETWLGASLNSVLAGYLESLKKRRIWWDDVDKARLAELALWIMKNNPVVKHQGGIKYEVFYRSVVPGYSENRKNRTRFPTMYRD